MKLKMLASAVAAVAFAFNALAEDPVKALLVVQNHSAEKDIAILTAMGDQLASALGDEMFEIINPNDVVGETQNVGPWGEKMPASSGIRLAESCGADVLLTAAITDCSRRNIGSPALAQQLVVTWTVAAKRVPGGGTICSVTFLFNGKKHAVRQFADNAATIRDETLRMSVRAVATEFLAKAKTKTFVPAKVEKVAVAFVANVAGADVKIDGVSVGVAATDLIKPLSVEVSKGLHNLEVSYPFMIPYRTTARFDGPSTFAVNLRETVEGRALRRGDELLAASLERILKGGATDDDVKLITAKGYAKCLEASSFKVEGMPERLTVVGGMPDAFGLGIIQEDK